MRAGPLSNGKVIALLNQSFVPVYAVNEDYAPKGPAPACEKDSLTLHLVARSLDGRGAWSDFPVEDWIVLSRAETQTFLGPKRISPGTAWDIDREIATKLLTHFYPATENNDVTKNKFDRQSLQATVVAIDGGVARARLEGSLKMEHWFYHKPDGRFVEATVVGFVDLDPARKQIRSLRLVTEEARYSGGRFAIGLRSVDTE